MRKIMALVSLCAGLLVAALTSEAPAQYEMASITVRGSYIQVRRVNSSSYTATALFPVDVKRIDGMCRVNGNYTVWIGTVSAQEAAIAGGRPHSNVREGFPLLSSETYKLDGQLSGIEYFTCDAGVSDCELRCLDGMVR